MRRQPSGDIFHVTRRFSRAFYTPATRRRRRRREAIGNGIVSTRVEHVPGAARCGGRDYALDDGTGAIASRATGERCEIYSRMPRRARTDVRVVDA